ncbi:type II toxin-antitoxin system RelE/ParE family toxin [Stratiformator vulcanicus]|uniref:Plasmid stabilization system protein n=1 Tax=Stratiformator vulcanicus TaxID=2527980 RepID=A0A517R463_9PLAN|nr:type II toxin-antitoxin system RelE/ParE family toxin [Stratiformator vulcanicus]QDT38679.1 Plasmid stabilization system protein [Stratiformator vulcanicus]
MASVELDPIAQADIDRIYDYLGDASRSPAAADRLVDDMTQKSQIYAENPLLGTDHSDLRPALRSFTFGTPHNRNGWVAFYRTIDGGIEILRIFRGTESYDSEF